MVDKIIRRSVFQAQEEKITKGKILELEIHFADYHIDCPLITSAMDCFLFQTLLITLRGRI